MRNMSRFEAIVILVLLAIIGMSFISVMRACAEEPFVVEFRNDTKNVVRVYMYNVDHNYKQNGRLYPFPINICGGEIQPGNKFILTPRKHNRKPYRYIVKWDVVKNWSTIRRKEYIVTIEPEINFVLITDEGCKKW